MPNDRKKWDTKRQQKKGMLNKNRKCDAKAQKKTGIPTTTENCYQTTTKTGRLTKKKNGILSFKDCTCTSALDFYTFRK